MTIDNQINRDGSPLACVSNQIYSCVLDQPSEPVADNENKVVIEDTKTVTPTNQFEGFGSFG